MTIRPIDLNGMIQRDDDVSILKKQEDSKAMHDQQNIQMQVNKREDELAHRVVHADQSQNARNNADAKNEGRNKYQKNKTNKKEKDVEKNRVVEKHHGRERIDIKI